MSVRQYRWHHCGQRHLSGRKFAACAFSGDFAKRGTGQWAVVTFCSRPTIALFRSKAAAAEELSRLDVDQCGQGCLLHHELAFLDLAHAQTDVSPRPFEVA